MERCLSGHLYAMTRGDEDCPVCASNRAKYQRIAELEQQLEAERAKTAYAKTLLRKALDTGIGHTLEIASAFANDRPYPEDILAALQTPEVKP